VQRSLKLSSLEEWYSVSLTDLHRIGVSSILKHQYGGSVYELVKQAFPGHTWQPWRFSKLPRNYFDNLQHQTQFFDWFAQKHNIKSNLDWYSKNWHDLAAEGGLPLLRRHGSFYAAVQSIYPNHTFLPWKFTKTPPKIWKSRTFRRLFFVELARQLQLGSDPKTWPSAMTVQLVHSNGGGFMLDSFYNNSISTALTDLFPEEKFYGWTFPHAPSKTFDPTQVSLKDLTQLIQHSAKQLGIVNLSDWLDITYDDLVAVRVAYGLKQLGGLRNILQRVYPSHNWNVIESAAKSQQKKRQQRRLESKVHDLALKGS